METSQHSFPLPDSLLAQADPTNHMVSLTQKVDEGLAGSRLEKLLEEAELFP